MYFCFVYLSHWIFICIMTLVYCMFVSFLFCTVLSLADKTVIALVFRSGFYRCYENCMIYVFYLSRLVIVLIFVCCLLISLLLSLFFVSCFLPHILWPSIFYWLCDYDLEINCYFLLVERFCRLFCPRFVLLGLGSVLPSSLITFVQKVRK